MNIEDWIRKFRLSWIEKDIPAVLALFSEDVIYWETPFGQLSSHEELASEWRAVQDQSNIQLDLEVFSSTKDMNTVLWHLNYEDVKGSLHRLAGTYLITLNDAGLCTYFHHTGELQKP